MYKALTVINLPYHNDGKGLRKEPGEKITKAEMNDAQQTDDDIKALIDSGAISEDMDADIHPAHLPVDPNAPTVERLILQARELHDRLGEDAPPEVQRLAKMDHRHVTSSEGGVTTDVGRRS